MTAPSVREALELKPCPFCGSKPHRGLGKVWHDQLHGEPHQDYSIWCPKDHAKITLPAQDLAIREWNTRATPPAPTPSAGRIAEELSHLVVDDDSDDADDECELCGGRGSVDAYTERTRDQSGEGRDEIGCPACIERQHSRTVKAILTLLPDAAAIRAAAFEEAALTDVAAERKRQREVEGWTPEHDDGHSKGELAAAAACYAVGRCILEGSLRITERGLTKNLWPWSLGWWKPKDHRRNLVRAAALIVAEIERIDRAAAIRAAGEKS